MPKTRAQFAEDTAKAQQTALDSLKSHFDIFQQLHQAAMSLETNYKIAKTKYSKRPGILSTLFGYAPADDGIKKGEPSFDPAMKYNEVRLNACRLIAGYASDLAGDLTKIGVTKDTVESKDQTLKALEARCEHVKAAIRGIQGIGLTQVQSIEKEYTFPSSAASTTLYKLLNTNLQLATLTCDVKARALQQYKLASEAAKAVEPVPAAAL